MRELKIRDMRSLECSVKDMGLFVRGEKGLSRVSSLLSILGSCMSRGDGMRNKMFSRMVKKVTKFQTIFLISIT